jgi:uncharacterized protein
MLNAAAKPPSRLRRLDGALADLPVDEAMLLTELDGFLAGILVCPEDVAQAEWLPFVWGGGAPPFEEAEDHRWFAGMVAAYAEELARALDRGRYQPLLDVDERNGELLWEAWVDGFEHAMTLRPGAWAAIDAAGDDETRAALAGLRTLIAIAHNASDLAHHEIDAIADRAAELIPMWLAPLYAIRASRRAEPAAAAATVAKVGRNDPCPCGSGKKFKKCCG